MDRLSLVQVLFDEVNDPDKCGYCEKQDSSYKEGGIWTFNFTPQDEQYLLEHSWRRCGKFIYLFDKNKSCCPAYMIRCDVDAFELSHSQKRVLRKVTNYLRGSPNPEGKAIQPSKKTTIEDKSVESPGACKIVTEEEKSGEQKISEQTEGASLLKKIPKKGVGADPNKPQCIKAKERKKQKMEKKQANNNPEGANAIKAKQNEARTLKDHLNDHEYQKGDAHKLEKRLILVNPESEEYKATEAESYRIFESYQQAVHKDKPGKNNLKHYKDFLVTSAVMPHEEKNDIKYGCYHLQYFIDGKLFMVGVLDVLPNYVSSVYTYYDPNFMFLSPGVYSALSEIELTHNLRVQSGIKKWYCMGFFIYTIQKMSYKGEYHPSDINCPYTHEWVPYKDCLEKLKTGVYQNLAPDQNPMPVGVDNCLIFDGGNVVEFKNLPSRKKKNTLEKVRKYCELVGPDFSKKAVAIF